MVLWISEKIRVQWSITKGKHARSGNMQKGISDAEGCVEDKHRRHLSESFHLGDTNKAKN